MLLAGHRQAGKREREMKSSIANVSFPCAAKLRKEAYRACDQLLAVSSLAMRGRKGLLMLNWDSSVQILCQDICVLQGKK